MKKTVARCVVVAGGFIAAAGCGETPKKDEPPPQPELLDKLDSDDPDAFLEGVDEARDKYGKKP